MPKKHEAPESEKIQLPPKDTQEKIDEMFEQADKFRQASKFDESLKVFDEILKILSKYPWAAREKQVLEEKEETVRCKNKQIAELEVQKKRAQEELDRKQEEEKLIAASQRVRQKGLSEAEARKKTYAEQKARERVISENAYTALGQGTEGENKGNFDLAIQQYHQAIELFKQINWTSEVQRVTELVSEIQKRKQITERETQTRNAAAQELEQFKSTELAKETELRSEFAEKEIQKKKQLGEAAKLKKTQQDLSNMAFALIDEGNRLRDKQKDYDGAVAKYQEARKIMQQIGWEEEANKLLPEIARMKEDGQKYKSQQELQSQRRLKAGQEQELERKEEETRRQQLLRDREQELAKKEGAAKLKKAQQETSEKAFALMDQALRLKNEKKDYVAAIANYEKAGTLFAEIGWDGEAQKVIGEINRLKEEGQRHQKQQLLDEEKRKRNMAELEASRKEEEVHRQQLLKEKEQELAKKDGAAKLKKVQQEKSEKAFALIDQANRAKSEKRDYANAIGKLEDAAKLFSDIGWADEAQKLQAEVVRTKEEGQKYQKQQALDQDKRKMETAEQERARQEEEARRQQLLKERELESSKKDGAARLKKVQQEQSEVAFKIIDEGNRLKTEKKDFASAVGKYEEAVKIFSDIGWTDEAQKLQAEAIRTKEEGFRHQKLHAQEEEKRRREAEERERLRQEEETRRQQLFSVRDQERTKIEEATRIKKTQEKLSNMAFTLIDEANRLKVEKKDYATAIAKYEDAGKLFAEIKWDAESQKVLGEINRLKEEWAKYKKLLGLEEEKRKKEATDRERFKQEEEARRDQLLKEREKELAKKEDAARLKKIAQEKSDEAFALIDIANRVKDEKKDFASSIDKYQQAQKLFAEIGWDGEAQKVQAEISRIKDEWQKYKKLQELEEAKRQKESIELTRLRQEEEARRQQVLKERDQERAKLEEVARAKKVHQELSETAFKLIDEGNHLIEDKKDYETAIGRYQEGQKIFNNIGWQDESQKILAEIGRLKEDWAKWKKFQSLEEEKRRKEVEEREVARQDEENRRLQLQRDQERKQLEEMKKKEEAQYKQEASNWAFKLIDDAETLAKQYTTDKAKKVYKPYPFDAIMEKYQEAKKTLTEIGWQTEVDRLLASMQHHRTTKEQEDIFLRTVQERRAKDEVEKREFEALVRQNEKEVQQKRAEGEKKHLEELTRRQKYDQIMAESDKLAEKANKALIAHQHQNAIDLYRQILKMYEEIQWQEGIEKIQEAIFNTRSKEKEYQAEQARLQSFEEQKSREAEELETQIRGSQKEQWEKDQKDRLSREERLKKQKLQEQAQTQIFDALGEANKLVRDNKFDEAVEKVTGALALFSQVDDPIQEGQVRDFIPDIKRKKADYLRQREQQERLQQDRLAQDKEQQELISKADEERRKREQEEKARSSTKLEAQKRDNELSSKAYGLLDGADLLIIKGKIELGIAKLTEARKYFQELGWEKELKGLDARIEIEQRKISADLERKREMEKSKQLKDQSDKVYQVLDNAEAFFRRGKTQLGIEKLEEALKTFNQLGWEKEADALAKRIEFEKQKVTQEQVKAKGLEKSQAEKELSDKAYEALDKADVFFSRNKFQLGIDKMEEGLKIFKQLGWEKEALALEQRMDQERQKVAKDQAKVKVLAKAQQEKELSDKALEAIDKADAFFKRNKTNLGLQQLDVAIEIFTQLGWEKELQAVKRQAEEEQKKVQVAVERRKVEAKTAQEKEQADRAYVLLDEADNQLRTRRFTLALEKYQEAQRIFKSLGWDRETKQLEAPIEKLQGEIKDEDVARDAAKKKKDEFKTSPDYAFQLLDESERLFRNRKIDEAIEKATEVKRIFEMNKWEKEGTQVDVFIGTLKEEKKKQTEQLVEQDKVREEKIKKESEEEVEKQRLIDERRRKRQQERSKHGD